MVARNERLTVLPGPLDEAELRSRIEGAESVAIMKVGRHLPKIRGVIDDLGFDNPDADFQLFQAMPRKVFMESADETVES